MIQRHDRLFHYDLFSRIENPRIVLLDCSLEYKKGESQTALEFSGEPDFTYVHRIVASLTLFDFISSRMLQLEEESIHAMCQDIIAVKPDVVVTEKGISGTFPSPSVWARESSSTLRCGCALFGRCWYIGRASYEEVR